MAPLDRHLCLRDFERSARRKLPRGVFGFIQGGSEDESALNGNLSAFDDYCFVTRVLVDTSERTTAIETLGRNWAAPIGISPMGAVGVAGFHADLSLAQGAARANIPFILSSSSLISLERIIAANPEAWFQVYPSRDIDETKHLVRRVSAAGYSTLIVTVDVPVPGNREENIRNGYSSPLRPTRRFILDALLHPRWLTGTFLRSIASEGMPHFENMAGQRAPMFALRAKRSHGRDNLSWSDVAALRDLWPGKFVLKGLLDPRDIVRAAKLGVDAVIASNHGGRQLDGAASPLHLLAPMKQLAGSLPIFYEGGIRRGTAVLKAMALGAGHVFVGRPFLYAAVVGGADGVFHAARLLESEISRNLALLGSTSVTTVADRLMRQPRVLRTPVESADALAADMPDGRSP